MAGDGLTVSKSVSPSTTCLLRVPPRPHVVLFDAWQAAYYATVRGISFGFQEIIGSSPIDRAL